MRTTIIRALLILCVFLLARFVLHWPEALLFAFVVEYVLEPVVISKT